MHYSKLLRVFHEPASSKLSSMNNTETGESPVNQIDNNNMQKLVNWLREYSEAHPVQAPEGYDDTVLDDDQINQVLTRLLELKDKYFGDLDMKDRLNKKFFWNMPEEIYKAYCDARDLDDPDIFDPLMFFYLFCITDPRFEMGKYVSILYEQMKQYDTVIKERATEYDNYVKELDNIEDGVDDG